MLNSLWAISNTRLKIESRRTPLIIRFLGTKTKINIPATKLAWGTFVKVVRKGEIGAKCTALTEKNILYHISANIEDICTYYAYEMSRPRFLFSKSFKKIIFD